MNYHQTVTILTCLILSVNAKILLKHGIPELDVPVLEPIEIDDLFVDRNLNINITGLKLHNLLSFDIVDLSAYFEKYQFAFVIQFTNVTITGTYSIDTKLLNIPLQGHGLLFGQLGSIHCIGKLKGKRVQREGKTYVALRFLEFRYADWKNVKFSLTRLFPNNKQLAAAATNVVEDSSDVLLEEIIPELEEVIKRKVLDVSNKFVSKKSVDELFPSN